ncbi:helix-turn-helix transcriptional regulator [Lysinibacillus sp. KU-BSD001]|uniref:helix-turn-helix domain-containing protein n=1 Tax=Lysinibacillus sp. KU-BSD001 TaxID=3141328 RepID=UPI0036E6DA01
MSVQDFIKELRGEQTQQQFAFDLGVVRETVSKYENGRSKVPADISRRIVDKFDDPRFAMTIQQEYTGTGPIWLNGENVDLHRCSVKEKTIEELQEALKAIHTINLATPFHAVNHFNLSKLEEVLEEAVEAITALQHFVAITCAESGLSYRKVWTDHYNDLEEGGFAKRG